jgi:hypothetical protein
MERAHDITGIGGIYAVLVEVSNRPRYAFLVLQLVAEAADGRGQAGPFIAQGGVPVLLREWLCSQLLPISEQPARRAALRARVAAALKEELTGDAIRDTKRIDAAVEEQVQAVGRANVSRAISDLVRAGLMTRHYAGYATNHKNRGGGRHAVYVVKPGVLALLRKPAAQRRPGSLAANPQGELFAA